MSIFVNVRFLLRTNKEVLSTTKKVKELTQSNVCCCKNKSDVSRLAVAWGYQFAMIDDRTWIGPSEMIITCFAALVQIAFWCKNRDKSGQLCTWTHHAKDNQVFVELPDMAAMSRSLCMALNTIPTEVILKAIKGPYSIQAFSSSTWKEKHITDPAQGFVALRKRMKSINQATNNHFY